MHPSPNMVHEINVLLFICRCFIPTSLITWLGLNFQNYFIKNNVYHTCTHTLVSALVYMCTCYWHRPPHAAIRLSTLCIYNSNINTYTPAGRTDRWRSQVVYLLINTPVYMSHLSLSLSQYTGMWQYLGLVYLHVVKTRSDPSQRLCYQPHDWLIGTCPLTTWKYTWDILVRFPYTFNENYRECWPLSYSGIR